MINRQTFHYIYVNANSLTELALRNLSSDLDSLLDDLEPIDNVDNADIDFDIETNLENLNFAAMDGLEFYDPEIATNIPEPVSTYSTKATKDFTNSIQTSMPEQIGDFDIEIYMTNVYSLEEQLSEQIDNAYNRIEHDQIQLLLNQLPPELPLIDKKMSGENMTLWLEQYSNNVESITNLLVAIRQLDFTDVDTLPLEIDNSDIKTN